MESSSAFRPTVLLTNSLDNCGTKREREKKPFSLSFSLHRYGLIERRGVLGFKEIVKLNDRLCMYCT